MSLDEELIHLAEVGRAQAWMLDHARMRVATGEQVAGDRYTAETLGRMLKSYAKELADEPEAPPFFGRLTFGGSPGRQLAPAFGVPPEFGAEPEADDKYYIGRRRITDEAGTPLVIDWRAPVSARFYRAGAREPMGVATRRRYGWTIKAPIRLTGFEDEHLDLGEEIGTASRLLTAEIERPRIGPMRDIVATIQPEQDELVRADLSVSLCVQGGPGTGKTAVGLHRAAFLLYAHRGQLARTGVMVVGPNLAFLQYISAVLPALGEVDVSQRTLGSVISDISASSLDAPDAALIKHDVRMAAVLRRALYALITPPTASLLVPDGSYRLRVDAGALARQVSEISASDVPYQIGRERLRARILGLLQRQLEWHGESPTRAWLDKIGRSAPVKAILDTSWPRVRPAELLATLLGNRAVLAQAADGILTDEEQATIRWPRPRSFRTARWSPADLVLLDEIAGLIAHPEGFGHIVVDEAQDLSPMECRALARRSRHGSLTVLGDLAQGTAPWAAADWPTQMAHLGKPDGPVTALTLGFRVPGVVLDLANRLLPALLVAAPQTRAVRTDGALDILPVTDLAAAVSDRVRAALEQEGSIAVIATELRLATLALDDVDDRVTPLPATLAKGLEFDHVIVVEPAEIVRSEERGLHRLYVVLTRAVSRLDVLHAESLPEFFPPAERRGDAAARSSPARLG